MIWTRWVMSAFQQMLPEVDWGELVIIGREAVLSRSLSSLLLISENAGCAERSDNPVISANIFIEECYSAAVGAVVRFLFIVPFGAQNDILRPACLKLGDDFRLNFSCRLDSRVELVPFC